MSIEPPERGPAGGAYQGRAPRSSLFTRCGRKPTISPLGPNRNPAGVEASTGKSCERLVRVIHDGSVAGWRPPRAPWVSRPRPPAANCNRCLRRPVPATRRSLQRLYTAPHSGPVRA